MNEESRVVRDLIDANLHLTNQIVELARLVIGAPVTVDVERAPMDQEAPASPFVMSTADDWEDIPDVPIGHTAQVLEIPRRPDTRQASDELPLHMSEEEEDMRYRVGMEIEPPKALTDLLTRIKAPNVDIQIEPLA
jgi:hypothetical protein